MIPGEATTPMARPPPEPSGRKKPADTMPKEPVFQPRKILCTLAKPHLAPSRAAISVELSRMSATVVLRGR